jgi:phage terminase large subunit-like protein
MRTAHELVAAFGLEAVRRWASGEEVDGLGSLTDDEAITLASMWSFWARPGQRWTPGPETITYYSCGRGFGKSLVLFNALGEAASEPARWGYEALLLGITPGDARSLCEQDTGIFRVAQAYGYPMPTAKWTVPGELYFPAPPGEPRGLHVRIASSAKPESARGPNVGLILADEWAFFHDTTDEQGLTVWEAAMNALRIGEAKALIVSSPSRKLAVREMRRDAEEPMCRACKARLPRLAPVQISTLFSATTTAPRRACPSCGAAVISRVRLISASSLDNAAHLEAGYVDRVREMLDAGSRRALGELGGQILDDDAGTPIPSIRVHDLATLRPGRDPWLALRRDLGIVRVVIQVDPATTGGEGSADTGVLAVGVTARVGDRPPRVYGLQDWSLPAVEVEGSPSQGWAPRVAILAALWRAEEVAVEVNQGGLEVSDPPRQALARLTTADLERAVDAMRDPTAPHPLPPLDALALSEALRAARAAMVETITRRADKATRWDWASGPASTGDLSLLLAPWLPRDHWTSTVDHLTRYSPAPTRRGRQPIDRGDTLIGAAQQLLGVRERGGALLLDPLTSPLYQGRGLFG